MSYQDIITIEPGKRGGKPCIRGMRITVYDVLEYLASGVSQQEVLDDFPYLTEEDIRACLAYAADREKRLLIMAAGNSSLTRTYRRGLLPGWRIYTRTRIMSIGRCSMIYLDNNGTIRVLPDVLEAMLPYFTTDWGNPYQ